MDRKASGLSQAKRVLSLPTAGMQVLFNGPADGCCGSYNLICQQIVATDPTTQPNGPTDWCFGSYYPKGRRIGALDPAMGRQMGVLDPTTKWISGQVPWILQWASEGPTDPSTQWAGAGDRCRGSYCPMGRKIGALDSATQLARG